MTKLKRLSLIARLYVLALLCLSALSACHDDTPRPENRYRRVAVVYMMAENSLSAPYATTDLSEMRKAVDDIPDSCLLVVFFDNSRTDQKPQILAFERGKNERVLFEYTNDPISTDSATMLQALNFIAQRCPAKEYGLTLWSHGSGWIPREPAPRRTIGVDNGRNTNSNTGLEMEIPTLTRVLRQTGLHWNYVFFDACFMQGIEVAYELRDVTDWCIGSPAEIPGNGAPYDLIMADLFRPADEVWRIAEDYYEAYRAGTGVVLSAARSDQLEPLAAATASLLASRSEYPTDGIQQYLTTDDTRWKPEYFDMGSAMHQWLTEEAYATWCEALERAVPHRFATSRWMSAWAYAPTYQLPVTDPEHIACLSMYIPIEGRALNEAFTRCSWYRASGWKQVE